MKKLDPVSITVIQREKEMEPGVLPTGDQQRQVHRKVEIVISSHGGGVESYDISDFRENSRCWGW